MTSVRRGLLVVACFVAAAALAAGLARGSEPAPVTFGRAEAVLTTERSRVVLKVEVARTPDQHGRGLMYRRYLAPKAGMAFVFSSDVRVGFWMKNTLIPLSIAFYDRRGKILRIMQMAPCQADPCPLYDPKVAYRGALEVNRGAFGRWGVNRGDRITLRPRR